MGFDELGKVYGPEKSFLWLIDWKPALGPCTLRWKTVYFEFSRTVYFRKSYVFRFSPNTYCFCKKDHQLSGRTVTLPTAVCLSQSFDVESNETVFENDYF